MGMKLMPPAGRRTVGELSFGPQPRALPILSPLVSL